MNRTPVLPDCLSVDELSRYFAGNMIEDRIEQIDRHLLECVFCHALSERVANATREVLEGEWDANPAMPLAFLEPASRTATELSGVLLLRDRVHDWIRIGAEFAVRVAMPFADHSAVFKISGLEMFLAPAGQFNLREASVGVFLGAADSDASSLEGPVLEIPGEGRRRARVVVDAAEVTCVRVQVDNVPATIRPPLTALQIKDGGQTYVKEMTRAENGAGDPDMIDLTADFHIPVATREVLVLIEPFTS